MIEPADVELIVTHSCDAFPLLESGKSSCRLRYRLPIAAWVFGHTTGFRGSRPDLRAAVCSWPAWRPSRLCVECGNQILVEVAIGDGIAPDQARQAILIS